MSRRQPPRTSPDHQVRRIQGGARAAVDALLAAKAATFAAITDGLASLSDAETTGAPTLLLEHDDRCLRATRLLARQVILADDPGPLEAAREALEETTMSLADVVARTPRAESALPGHRLDAASSEECRMAVAEALREIGLSELDVSLHLATDPDGAVVIAWQPLPRETAIVYLLEQLYDRIEATVLTDPLLYLERQASRWWFDRWSGRRKAPEEHFAWGVREQEWTLVDRVSVALEAPILSAFLEQDLPVANGERHRQLALALVRSRADLFLVAEHHGSTTVFEGLVDGRRYDVHEHNPELSYRPGDLGAGRLIPIEPGRFLRSPGLAFMGKLPRETLLGLGRFMALPMESPAPAVRVEMLITRLRRGETIPRPLPPASSPAEAQEYLTEVRELLADVGRAEVAPASEVPPELVASTRGTDGIEYWRFDVDEVLQDWITALIARAKKLGAGAKGGGSPATRKKVKKKRKR